MASSLLGCTRMLGSDIPSFIFALGTHIQSTRAESRKTVQVGEESLVGRVVDLSSGQQCITLTMTYIINATKPIYKQGNVRGVSEISHCKV